MTLIEMQEKKKQAIEWLKGTQTGTLRVLAGEIPLLTVNRYNGNVNIHCKTPKGACHCHELDISEMEYRLTILDEENPVIAVQLDSLTSHVN